MKLLVSLFNKGASPSLRDPGVYLYLVDSETGGVEPVPTEHPDITSANGMTGLCFHEGAVVGVRQRRPNQLVILNRESLAVEAVRTLDLSMAGHSLLSRDGDLYLAATGLNAVLRVTPDAEELIWQHPDGDTDSIHCNGLAQSEGRLLCCGFGPRKGELWSSANAGFVRDVDSGEVLVSDIVHPHALTVVDGVLHWCEGSRMSVCNDRGQRLVLPLGYARGLHVGADQLIVGLSSGRRQAASSGERIERNTEAGERVGSCQVLIYQRDRQDLAGCSLLRSIDLSGVGSEIFDLLPLG